VASGLSLDIVVVWIAVWTSLCGILIASHAIGGRARPTDPTMLAATAFGVALMMILAEAVGTRGTASRGFFIVVVAACGALGWVAVATTRLSLPSRPLKLRLEPPTGRAVGLVSGPLGFALLLVAGTSVSPADAVDWTTTQLAVDAILAGSLGWVVLWWIRSDHRWVSSFSAGSRRPERVLSRPVFPATQALIVEFQQRWVRERSAPRPPDRAAAEAAADAIYADLGLDPPRLRIWLRSPREMAIARPLIEGFCAYLAGGRLVLAAWEATLADVETIDPEVVATIDAQLRSRSIGRIGAGIISPSATYRPVDLVPPARQPDRAGVGRWAASEAANPLDLVVNYQLERDGVGGRQRSTYTTSTRHIAGAAELGCLVAMSEVWPTPSAKGLARLAETCDGWWSFDGLSVLQDPPSEVHADATGRLHAEDGPAIRYQDGWAAWAVHGIAMPRVAVESPASLRLEDVRAATARQRPAILQRFGLERYRSEAGRSAELIGSEPDPAMRRQLIETYGPERFLQAVGEIVHEDVDGLGQPRRLWRAARAGDEALVMVEVRNSTPEPDGSRRTYWLRVPPFVHDCQAAVAWTFGITSHEFVVQAEA
jgi:hypothetical protein